MSKFNDIEDIKLRNYNRAMLAMNLAQDKVENDVRSYFSQFNEQERVEIMVMLLAIRTDPEETRRQVIVNANTH